MLLRFAAANSFVAFNGGNFAASSALEVIPPGNAKQKLLEIGELVGLACHGFLDLILTTMGGHLLHTLHKRLAWRLSGTTYIYSVAYVICVHMHLL